MRSFVLFASTVVLLASACSTTLRSPSAPSKSGRAASTPTDALVAASPALPQPADLTLAREAGSILIGLSVRPALPGPNTMLLYVAPLAGPTTSADVPLTLDVAGTSVPLTTCSRSCRSATVTLIGGEHVRVRADGADGGTASFDLPALPAPDGGDLLKLQQDRMHHLRSYRVDEILGPAQPQLTASYTFQAPDRMRMELGSGATTILIGPTRYTRKDPSTAWQAETIGSGSLVPSFEWDSHSSGDTAASARVVGQAVVDGIDTRILAFFYGTPQTPIWFQLGVDANGLVHTAEMRAQGHFMTHRYFDFGAAVAVEAPQP
jgi:hypothetical protein